MEYSSEIIQGSESSGWTMYLNSATYADASDRDDDDDSMASDASSGPSRQETLSDHIPNKRHLNDTPKCSREKENYKQSMIKSFRRVERMRSKVDTNSQELVSVTASGFSRIREPKVVKSMAACEKRAKSEAGDDVDRISALLIHLKESILECLPIQDAMKTSILSKKWRYSWTGMRILKLGNYRYDGRIGMLRRDIDRILLLHSGPLRKCDIRIPMNGNVSNINLADWVYALAKNGLQDHSIDVFAIVDPFPIPSSLFNCQYLMRLSLNHFKLKLAPQYVGFRNHVYLEINFGEMPSHVLGNLISQSPLLDCRCTKYEDSDSPNSEYLYGE